MSLPTSTSFSSDGSSKENLIDKILEQGQRLRNAMVQSILDHDPFNTDVINGATTRSLVKSRLRKRVPSRCSISNNDLGIEQETLKAFLKGDSMNRKDEIDALETLRSMSGEDLCKATNEAYNKPHSRCACITCTKYAKEDLNCDLKRSTKKYCCKTLNVAEENPDIVVPKVQFHPEPNKYMKYVDCMKVTIEDLVFNERGNKKINASLSDDKKVPVWGSQTFFIEYELPFILSVSTHRKNVKRSMISTKNNSFVRICARRLSTEAVHFKQTSMHNIKNVDQINLEGIEMKFQISCRTMKQKNVVPLGYAVFNFARFESSLTLSCIEELSINFNDSVPIVLGKLRVTLQMGCDRLYFGREFIASLKETSTRTSDSTSVLESNAIEDHELNKTFSEKTHRKVSDSHNISNSANNKTVPKYDQDKLPKLQEKFQEKKDGSNNLTKYESHRIEKPKPSYLETVRIYEKQILIGFLYIPEAQYLDANIKSFIRCRPFCQEDSSYSKVVTSGSNPIFNFCQVVPLVYQDDLLQQFRDNIMVIEFWEKFETKDILFGLTKLPLHQFYVAYRNPDVTKYLANNKLPIISSDWWEAIANPYTDELVGQVQILLALGTEQQIHNLELERGFKAHTVKANFEAPLENPKIGTNLKPVSEKDKTKFYSGKSFRAKVTQPSLTEKVQFKGSTEPPVRLNKEIVTIVRVTEDKGVQSDIEMNSDSKKEKETMSNDKLGQLLNQIITMQTQRSTLVETGTNTDTENVELNSNKFDGEEKKTENQSRIPEAFMLPTSSARTLESEPTSFSSSKQYENAPPLVRSTSDLLNTLQAALSLPPTKRPLISANRSSMQDQTSSKHKILSKQIRTSFKAQISINQALHLPVRKKCKGKKSKGRAGRLDDNVKPSSYVTFETMPGLDLKITPLVPKCTSPNWNYKCDVFLPSELLFNNQKRLIFKVWRKSTNTTMVPNLQSDLVVGFAAIDLTVLLSGFPNIQGWFNIIDFSSKCNGQINVHVTPLEDLTVFRTQKEIYTCSVSPSLSNEETRIPEINNIQKSSSEVPDEMEKEEEETEEPDSELLSRALKRKFTELDEITQRLRLRLSHVTNESDDGNDEIADEFEKDINSLSIEDDFDMVNFEEDGPNSSNGNCNLEPGGQLQIDCSSPSSFCGTDSSSGRLNSNSNVSLMMVPTQEEVTKEFEHTEESLSILDRQLLEGKQRIDTLLGKLSLISGDSNTFASRYISGCSTSNRSDSRCDIDTEAILKDLDLHSRPNIHASTSFDNRMFERIYEVAEKRNESTSSPSSGTSVISNIAELRAAPDGQGTFSEDRSKVKK